MDIEVLRALVSPEFGLDERVDWSRVESVWGLRFPDDYKEFMALYGAGSFNNSLHVHEPPTADPDSFATRHAALADELAWYEEDEKPSPYRAYPSAPGLIRWGGDYAADDFYWHVDGDDPNQWPVVVWNRGYAEWRVREPGMVRLLTGFLADHGSDEDLAMIWSVPGKPVRFISEKWNSPIGEPWPDLLSGP